MYVDNELTAQQQRAGGKKMQQNPDLQSEMDMLQQAKLLPDDDIFFGNKEAFLLKALAVLARRTMKNISLNYIDEELDATGRQEVGKICVTASAVQEAFTLLKQTKPDEVLVFEDKQSLYRKKRTEVIPLMLKRFAIAAIFTGIGIAVWMMLPKTHEQGQIVQAQPENTYQSCSTRSTVLLTAGADNNNAQQSTIALTGEKEKQKVQDIAPVVKATK